jgi:FkbM family methyltransferase
MLDRLQRKFHEVSRYPALAYRRADRRPLWALGLWRNRLLSAKNAIRLAGRPVIAPRLTVTQGQPVRLTLGNYSELDCFDELFIDRIYQLERVPFTPDLVLDCGAFRGYFCALARGGFPDARMVCFEPNPEHRAPLAAQLSGLSKPAETQAMALSTRDDYARFGGHDMGGALLKQSSPAADPSIVVQTINFPRWLAAQSCSALVWKLDVEGAETELLPATLQCLPPTVALFLETHSPDEKCAEILSPYRNAGFAISEVRRRQMGDNLYIEWFLLRTRHA